MSTALTARPDDANAAQGPVGTPYARSWVNAVIDWFDRLPGPAWLAYAAAMAGGCLLSFATLLLESTPDPGAIIGIVYYGALPFAVLGLIANLDRTATRALATLRPLLRLTDAEIEDARQRLTVVPARPALLLTIGAIAITPVGYVLDPVGSGVAGSSPVGIAFRWAWEAFVTAVFLILTYHTIRQLRVIARLHESMSEIDLFDQARLYALSSVTSTTSVGLILLLAPSLFLIPTGADTSYLVITAGWYGLALAIAIGAFIAPLGGVHGRLASDKARLRAEVGRRLTVTLEAIHRGVDTQDRGLLETAQQSLSALTTERDLVARVPTWPWSTGSLTRLLSAVLLPIGLFLVTRLLERFV